MIDHHTITTIMSKRTVPMNTRDVPIPVRDQFKAYCARRGYTMQGAIIALMRKATIDNMPLHNAGKKDGATRTP